MGLQKLLPLKRTTTAIISYLFILLFTYAAISKLLDFRQFTVQLGQSPMLSAFADEIAIAVPLMEILVTLMLFFPRLQLAGLIASFNLMVMFTTYILIILNFTDFIPCSCGGVLEDLDWTEHLLFNLFFIFLSIAGMFLAKDYGAPFTSKKLNFKYQQL